MAHASQFARQGVCLCLLALLLTQSTATTPDSATEQDDVAGPIVKNPSANNTGAETATGTASPGTTAATNSDSSSTNGTASPATAPSAGDPKLKKTIAQVLDEALEQEFPQQPEGTGQLYTDTSKNEEAKLVTVLKVTQTKDKPTGKAKTTEGSVNLEDEYGVGVKAEAPPAKPNLDAPVEKEIDWIVDEQDNKYVLSTPKDGTVGLVLDPQLIRDLTVLIASAALAGLTMEAMRQPVINGYFIAGSIVGPGGLRLIKELVQIESLAQLGVQLLLFTLGLEFSLSKLRAVRSVALIGGLIQIFLFMILAGLLANFIGASVHEGVFVGALVSMSSTSIVVKCLTDSKAQNSPHGQITIGTLILQDCMVGLLFAFMPVLGSKSGSEVSQSEVAAIVLRVSTSLGLSLVFAALIARTILPGAMRLLHRGASEEMYTITTVAFCLSGAWILGHLQLSTELGAFVAGVMLSVTDQQEVALHRLESIKSFFIALFISSTGLIMSPTFLMQHLPVLALGVLFVVLAKTILISLVVWVFRYPWKTAMAVGLSMAQIGEFAFVLLSVATHFGLVPHQVYMLLMGVTALSLLLTPFLLQFSAKFLLPLQTFSGNGEGHEPREWLRGKRKDSTMIRGLDVGEYDEEVPLRGHLDAGLDHRGKDARAHVSLYPSENQLNQRFTAQERP